MINICIRVLCARHMATSSDQKREGVFVRVFATAMCKIADCSIVSVRCRRKDGKCSAEGVTRRNRSTGPKLRDQLLQAEVQVPSQQCLASLVEHTDYETFTKFRIQQCEPSNVFSAPLVALRDLNAYSFIFRLQARQRGSLSASTGCGWRTDATDSWVKTEGHHYEGWKQQRKDRSAHEDNFDAQNKIFAP